MKRKTIGDVKAFVRRLNLDAGANVTALESRFDTTRYMTPRNDLVAQVLLTHQTRMQASAKQQFFRRQILTGEDSSADFSHLSESDRKTILEILTDTKPEFAVQ